ncbi:MAG: hypothetical protein JWM21_2202 [Acidobacteria bacterium]|nr:hypothetical protein [Acidobacteriota bacterium]
MNHESRPRKPNRAAGIPDIPIDGCEPDAVSGAGILKRLGREGTNLGTLVTPDFDLVVSDAGDSLFGRDCSFEKPPQLHRQRRRGHAELAERSGIGIEDFAQAFVRPQKTGLGEIARTHPDFHLSQGDAVLWVSVFQRGA